MKHISKKGGGMPFRAAIIHIRRNAPEVEATFRAICRNRYCHPVRDWAIYDLAEAGGQSLDCVRRRYYRHLARLHEIFGVSPSGLAVAGRCATPSTDVNP